MRHSSQTEALCGMLYPGLNNCIKLLLLHHKPAVISYVILSLHKCKCVSIALTHTPIILLDPISNMRTIVLFVFVLGALSAAGEVVRGKPGQPAKIKCGVSTSLKDVEWRFNNEMICNIRYRRGMPSKGKGSTDLARKCQMKNDLLEISPVVEEDVGRYTCIVNGKTYEHRLYTVSASVNPSGPLQLGSKATLQCQVKGLGELTVEWQRPDGQPGMDHLNPVASSHAGDWLCKFSHEGAPYSETLTVNIVKEPVPSPSPSIAPICHNCLPGVTDKPPGMISLVLGLSLWMWVAVGLGCLFLVLLVISVIILHRRNKRMKRKAWKLKNIRQPLKANDYCKCDRLTAAAPPPQGQRREKPATLPRQ